MSDIPSLAPPPGQPPLTPSTEGGWNLWVNLADLPKPLDPTALFGREAPFHVEVGCGSGLFTSRFAQDHPDINLLAMDNQGSETGRTNDKCRRRGLLNVRVLRVDGVYFLEDYPAPHSIDALHIYYPDPWWKTRHHKRRVWSPRLIPVLERVLKPGADLFLKTDVTMYFDIIQDLLRRDPGAPFLELVDEARLDERPRQGDYETNFQRKALLQGHPLHYQHWRRRDYAAAKCALPSTAPFLSH